MGRKLGDEGGVEAVICEGYRHVCLRASEGRLKALGLDETEVALRCEAEHQFAEGYYSFHQLISCDSGSRGLTVLSGPASPGFFQHSYYYNISASALFPARLPAVSVPSPARLRAVRYF